MHFETTSALADNIARAAEPFRRLAEAPVFREMQRLHDTPGMRELQRLTGGISESLRAILGKTSAISGLPPALAPRWPAPAPRGIPPRGDYPARSRAGAADYREILRLEARIAALETVKRNRTAARRGAGRPAFRPEALAVEYRRAVAHPDSLGGGTIPQHMIAWSRENVRLNGKIPSKDWVRKCIRELKNNGGVFGDK